jgi:hypothetical protein
MMQRFPVVRGRLLTGHLLLAALCFALAGVSGYCLLAFPPGLLSAAGLAVLAAVSLLIPAVVYRILLLLTAQYGITSTGALHIRFGTRSEVIPIEEIEEIRSGGKISDGLRKAGPGWLETWQGRAAAEGEEAVDWIATDRGSPLLLLVSKNRRWAISPSDPAAFARSVTDISAKGSLEKVESESTQPPPFILDILKTRFALASLAGGCFLIVALGVFLLAMLPTLPLSQPFRFNPSGLPSSLGDPTRLLILPFIGGAVWLLNAILGWRAWRTDQRLAAYALWVGASAVAGGLWVATLLLLRAG